MSLQCQFHLCYISIVKKFNKVYNAFEKKSRRRFFIVKKLKGGGFMKNIIYLYAHEP